VEVRVQATVSRQFKSALQYPAAAVHLPAQASITGFHKRTITWRGVGSLDTRSLPATHRHCERSDLSAEALKAEAIQSLSAVAVLDCFVARASRNDGV